MVRELTSLSGIITIFFITILLLTLCTGELFRPGVAATSNDLACLTASVK